MENKSQSPDASFNLFPKAPPEIRDMIWVRAAPHRVISISEVTYNTCGDNLKVNLAAIQKHNAGGFKSTADTPSIFHICRESRRAALKNYHLIFEDHCKFPFYFNPSTDIIFIDAVGDLNAFMSRCHLQAFVRDIQKIRYLALGYTIHDQLSVTPVAGQHFAKLKKLEKLIIQIGQSFDRAQLKKQLREHWNNSKETKRGISGQKVVMQNPDIVFLDAKEVRAVGIVSPVDISTRFFHVR